MASPVSFPFIKTDNKTINPSKFIFDLPAQIPIADLLRPTTIKITVWDEAEDTEGVERVTFEVLRGIICAKSEYFRSAFSGKFKEASEKEVNLKSVPPWVFKVFLTWLYTGLIYIEETVTAQDEACRKRKRGESVTIGHSASRGLQTTDGGLLELESDDEPVRKKMKKNSAQDHEEDEDDEDEEPARFSFWEENSIKSHRTHHAETQAPDEKDPSNPVTWPWSWLFDLYVFADQYDTVRLREQIMNFIQLRLDQRQPRMYTYPDHLDTKHCVERLPSSSPLWRLLVDLWAKNEVVSTHRDSKVHSQAKAMESMPPSFLVECFVALKGDVVTRSCMRTSCNSPSHDHGHKSMMQVADRCRYHEHEKTWRAMYMCEGIWGALEDQYNMPNPSGLSRE